MGLCGRDGVQGGVACPVGSSQVERVGGATARLADVARLVPGQFGQAWRAQPVLESALRSGARDASILASIAGFSAVNSCSAAASRLPITGHR